MIILVDYIRNWRIQLSIGKTVSVAYHLNNREANRELDVFVDNKRLVFQQASKNLGVRLDRMLNLKQHLEEVTGKVTTRISLIRHIAALLLQPGEPLPKKLRISTHAVVFPVAECCVWLSQSDTCVQVPVFFYLCFRSLS